MTSRSCVIYLQSYKSVSFYFRAPFLCLKHIVQYNSALSGKVEELSNENCAYKAEGRKTWRLILPAEKLI